MRPVGYTRSNLYYLANPRTMTAGQSTATGSRSAAAALGVATPLILFIREGLLSDTTDFADLPGMACKCGLGKTQGATTFAATRRPGHAPNERWSLDFMHDRWPMAARCACLNIDDDFTRECLAVDVDSGFQQSARDQRVRGHCLRTRTTENLSFDNGSELTSHAMLRWGAERQFELHFIASGKADAKRPRRII